MERPAGDLIDGMVEKSLQEEKQLDVTVEGSRAVEIHQHVNVAGRGGFIARDGAKVRE